MRRISSARPVLLGVLITLASVRSAWGCGGHDVDNVLHENRNLREIRRRHRDKGEVFPFCRTVAPTKGEVRTSMTAVTDFYRQADRDDDAKRRLQGGPIQIKVNFVVVSDSSGKGNVSQAMVVDQIAVLNAAFSPDFRFNLTSTQRVSNNTYFSFASTYPDPFSPAELALATRYRKGGTETLNIYSLLPIFPGNANLTLLGYAFYPYPFLHPGVADGAYVHYETLPGGGFADYAKGAVSTIYSFPSSRRYILMWSDLRFHKSLPSPRRSCTRSDTGLVCSTRMKAVVRFLVTGFLTHRHKLYRLVLVIHH
jgi:hypothetical protein